MSRQRSVRIHGLKRLDRRSWLGVAGAAVLAPFVHCGRSRGAPPNVLLIVADDVGRDVLSCCGSASHSTPAIDRLAAEGVRVEAAYATPLCVPSRAQLLTGLYPFRTGFTDNIFVREGGTPFLSPTHRTLAHELSDAGYATAVAGKWHLCSFEERPEHPRELGFDESLCWMWMEREGEDTAAFRPRYFSPSVIENGVARGRVDGAFGPTLYADFLIRFMQRSVGSGRSFFAAYPTVLPHAPWQTTPRQLGRSPVTQPPSDVMGFRRSLEALDREVARLVEVVRSLGVERDTLVVFTSDNGTPEEVLVRFSGELRPGGKGTSSEAGMRVPLIFRRPGALPAGAVSFVISDSTDLLPTILEAATGRRDDSRDGKSLLSALRGGADSGRGFAYSQLREEYAIRGPRMKLYSDRRLFDVVADPREERNLFGAEEHLRIQDEISAIATRVRSRILPTRDVKERR